MVQKPKLLIKKIDSPCLGCTDREAECHASCAKYLDWEKQRKAEYSKMRKKYDQELDAFSYEIKERTKNKKRSRK